MLRISKISKKVSNTIRQRLQIYSQGLNSQNLENSIDPAEDDEWVPHKPFKESKFSVFGNDTVELSELLRSRSKEIQESSIVDVEILDKQKFYVQDAIKKNLSKKYSIPESEDISVVHRKYPKGQVEIINGTEYTAIEEIRYKIDLS